MPHFVCHKRSSMSHCETRWGLHAYVQTFHITNVLFFDVTMCKASRMFLTGCIITCFSQALIFKATYLFITKSTVHEGKVPYRRLDHIWPHHNSEELAFIWFALLGYAADKINTCNISVPQVLTIRLHLVYHWVLQTAATHITTIPSSLNLLCHWRRGATVALRVRSILSRDMGKEHTFCDQISTRGRVAIFYDAT